MVSARGAAGFGEGLNLPSLSQTALKKKKKGKHPRDAKPEGDGREKGVFAFLLVVVLSPLRGQRSDSPAFRIKPALLRCPGGSVGAAPERKRHSLRPRSGRARALWGGKNVPCYSTVSPSPPLRGSELA